MLDCSRSQTFASPVKDGRLGMGGAWREQKSPHAQHHAPEMPLRSNCPAPVTDNSIQQTIAATGPPSARCPLTSLIQTTPTDLLLHRT
ncbi:hypothetical protein C0Q70_16804 [Pomacea canaliculata]|uniref:Uncharacterized protein n=1 Tax=Pomacea canaliculata TaxID=400727 RepID=A0A2T7NQV5_POMCA|nr:hypothetical protein C0Q70_16804 [Pomacea canaliculata]